MTNKEWLEKINTLALLCKIQENINDEKQCGMGCIIDFITSGVYLPEFGDHFHDCFTCIEHWLNEEKS